MLLFMTGADYASCQEQLKGMLIERIAALETRMSSKVSTANLP